MFCSEGTLFETQENQNHIATLSGLQQAMAEETILEARVSLCDAGHNLWVDLPCCKGWIPREEGALGIEEGKVRDIALISRVNRPVCFTVRDITVDPAGQPLAVLSRKAAQHRCRKEYIDRLTPGDVVEVRITHLEPFGAFCDVGCGISSLISIDCISVSRIFHPKERFAPGQTVKAVVRSLEADGRICLTHKELLGTWEENAALFQPGETVSGIIRTVESYGSFVELTPNLAGLAEPKDGVQPGQHAAVFIKSMIPEKMKVKLIIVDSFEAPFSVPTHTYFFDGTHISHWQYSPKNALKIMETRFDR